MAAPLVSWRRVKAGLVGLAGADDLLHGVVDFEDDALGAVVAVVLLLVLAADDGEGVHDVGHSVMGAGELYCPVIFSFHSNVNTWVAICSQDLASSRACRTIGKALSMSGLPKIGMYTPPS